MATYALPGRIRGAALILLVLLVLAGLSGWSGDSGGVAVGFVLAAVGLALAGLRFRLRFSLDDEVIGMRRWATRRIRLPDAAWFVMLRPGPGRPPGVGTRLNLSATQTRRTVEGIRGTQRSPASSLVAVGPDGAAIALPVRALRDPTFGAALSAALAAYPGPELPRPSAVRRTTDAPTVSGWMRRTILFAPGFIGRVAVVVGLLFLTGIAAGGVVSLLLGQDWGWAAFLGAVMAVWTAFGATLAWRDSSRARRDADWPWPVRAPRLDGYPLQN
jgi:hypothetical protein